MNKGSPVVYCPKASKLRFWNLVKEKSLIGMTYSSFRQHIIYIVEFYISRRSLEFDIFLGREDLKLW